MSFSDFMVHPVTITNPAAVADGYGDDTRLVYTAPPATTHTATGWLAQRTTAELDDHRNGIRTEWHGTFPADTPLTPHSRITHGTRTLDVQGHVDESPTPRRGIHHLEVDLVRAEG